MCSRSYRRPKVLVEEEDKKIRELASTAIINNESAIFAFNPNMSVPPPEYAMADAEYWNPKLAATPKAKTSAAARKR